MGTVEEQTDTFRQVSAKWQTAARALDWTLIVGVVVSMVWAFLTDNEYPLLAFWCVLCARVAWLKVRPHTEQEMR